MQIPSGSVILHTRSGQLLTFFCYQNIFFATTIPAFLGGMRTIGLPNNTDMDTIIDNGIYYNTSGTIVNGSFKAGVWIVFGCQIWGNVHAVLQIAMDPRGNSSNFSRPRLRMAWNITDNGWLPWEQIQMTTF